MPDHLTQCRHLLASRASFRAPNPLLGADHALTDRCPYVCQDQTGCDIPNLCPGRKTSPLSSPALAFTQACLALPGLTFRHVDHQKKSKTPSCPGDQTNNPDHRPPRHQKGADAIQETMSATTTRLGISPLPPHNRKQAAGPGFRLARPCHVMLAKKKRKGDALSNHETALTRATIEPLFHPRRERYFPGLPPPRNTTRKNCPVGHVCVCLCVVSRNSARHILLCQRPTDGRASAYCGAVTSAFFFFFPGRDKMPPPSFRSVERAFFSQFDRFSSGSFAEVGFGPNGGKWRVLQ